MVTSLPLDEIDDFVSFMKCECGYDPGSGGNRMMKHDAHWCPKCDKWLNTGCDDTECEFCSNRPEKPSMVQDQRKWNWND